MQLLRISNRIYSYVKCVGLECFHVEKLHIPHYSSASTAEYFSQYVAKAVLEGVCC